MAISPSDAKKLTAEERQEADRWEKIFEDFIPGDFSNGRSTYPFKKSDREPNEKVRKEIIDRFQKKGWKKVWYSPGGMGAAFMQFEE